MTRQFFSIRAYPRAALGASLHAAIDEATNKGEAARRLVPTNEGGLGLALHLYPSTLLGERLPIHVERYDRLPAGAGAGGGRAFAFESLGRVASLDTSAMVSSEADGGESGDGDNLLLGVFEWECELWEGVTLANTLDEYARMPLRNALDRGSAWGFFVVAIPTDKFEAGRACHPNPPRRCLVASHP